MDTTTLVLIGLAALVVLSIAALALRRGAGASPGGPWAPQNDPARKQFVSPQALGPAERAEIEELMQRGNKIGAIKRVRELTGMGLKEAKDFVEGWEGAGSPPALTISAPPAASGDGMAEVRALAAAGNKLAAIKRYRELSGVGLKEAKDFVDRLA